MTKRLAWFILALFLAPSAFTQIGCFPLDAFMVVDRSGSMGSGLRYPKTKSATQRLITLLEPDVDRAGLISFSTGPSLEQPLTASLEVVIDAIDELPSPWGGTRLDRAIDFTQSSFRSSGINRPALVLFTDGYSRVEETLNAASRAKREGTTLFVVAFQELPDLAQDLLSRCATTPEHYFYVNEADELDPLSDVMHQTLCRCGDGIVDPPAELCDDGNDVPNDGCTSCVPDPVCGDGVVEGWENCDLGSFCEDLTSCTAEIECAGIGDGLCLPRATNSCEADCLLVEPVCGNGVLEPGEQCDDGNVVDGDGC